MPASDVLRIIAGNSRTPDKAIGDIHALIAGANTIGRRIEEMIEQHGADTLGRFVQDWIDTTERRMRDEIDRIPGGTYRGTFTIEGDGFEAGKRFHVDAAVTAADGEIEIDFTGTSDQSGGAINASFSQTMSGVIYAVRCLVDPSIPMNEGCFRAVRTVLPPGTLVNPYAPAACGGRIISVTAGIEAILSAMAQALPDHEVAASALIHVYSLTGIGDDGKPWVNLFYDFGGVGGRHGVDGPDVPTGCYFLGGRSVIPQVERLRRSTRSSCTAHDCASTRAARGRWRGGLGTELVIELQGAAELTVRGDRIELPPPGAHGGNAGAAGAYLVERVDGTVEELPTKAVGVKLVAGDRFVTRTSGGGGLGSPLDRDADAVLGDVLGGGVTADGAARATTASLTQPVRPSTTTRRPPCRQSCEPNPPRAWRAPAMSANWFVGVDVGGTFTDVVLADTNGEVVVDKLPTTPEDPRVGVIERNRRVLATLGVAPADVSRVVHGTTLATNVILEQKGGPIAFVVTEGFADLCASA